MKIFLFGSNVPYRSHDQEGVTAVCTVLYELIRGLLQLDHEIVLQLIFNKFRKEDFLQSSEKNELDHLSKLGVTVLDPLYLEKHMGQSKSSTHSKCLERLLWLVTGRASIKDFYPAIDLKNLVSDRIRSARVDAILTIWSPEGVAATYGFHGLPKIVYQGDVDFIPSQVRLKVRTLFNGRPAAKTVEVSRWRHLWRERIRMIRFRQAHLRLMQDVDVIANVTASNADFYKKQGHPRSIYVQNTWCDSEIGSAHLDHPTIKIIGHVGYLDRTGSTYGLKFLLVDLLPALEEAMKGINYQIHLIGGGSVISSLQPFLKHPRVVVRGFVKDLDAELKSCDIFLMLNNAGSYQAAYTRHIMAWSMGLCLIVHENSRKAIPEIIPLSNALVGSTPSEIAKAIHLAATDKDLNQKIRQGGRMTYEKFFTPHHVAEALSEEALSLVNHAYP